MSQQEGKLLDCVNSNLQQVLAHSSCRKQFTYVKQEAKRKAEGERVEGKKRQTLSERGGFNWKEMFFVWKDNGALTSM